jgi:methyltransferase FkbM-like protein
MSLKFQWWRLTHPHRNRLRRRVIQYATESGLAQTDPDVAEAVDYLRKNPLDNFPYPFAENYTASENRVKHNPKIGLRYVQHQGNRLYWREGAKRRRIRRNYNALRIEQDERSPHRYLTPEFAVDAGDIVADIGCAEAILALDVVERARHLYLFESDGRWIKALEATFSPWKDKVTICHATLGAQSGEEGRVALDDYFANKPAPNFYKLDVEGSEAAVLNGARRTLARAVNPRLAVCTYHRPEDEANLAALLRELGFTPKPSRGYILLYDEKDFEPPYFRRGLLRATVA